MRATSVQTLCERFAKSFSLRNYAIDFHAQEGGAVGVCSHPSDSSQRMAVSNDKNVAVAFIGEIFNIEEIARLNDIKVSSDAADLILQLYQRDLLSSFSIANGLFCACIF